MVSLSDLVLEAATQNGPGILDGGGREYSSRRRWGVALRHVKHSHFSPALLQDQVGTPGVLHTSSEQSWPSPQARVRDKAALSAEVRQEREAASLLAVDRGLCSLIWRAQSKNLLVEFTADINEPVTILGVQIVTAPAVNASPGTSVGHSFPFGALAGGR
jgi:hypothetical protein